MWGEGVADRGKRPKVFYRYTLLMSVCKYAVGLMNTLFYRSTDQHSFTFALTKSLFKLYHILYIASSLLFCLFDILYHLFWIHILFSTIWRYQRDNQKPSIKYIWWHFQLCNIPWLSLGIDWWIRNSSDSNDCISISQQEQHDWCHCWSRICLPFRRSHRLLVMLNL